MSILFYVSFIQAEEKDIVPKDASKETLVFPATLAKAVKENKSIFLLFTGKDWCGPCQELEKSIIGTEEFTTFAKKKIIFLALDYPQTENGPTPENQKLAEEYGVDGFPTMFLTDEKGMPFQKFQFQGQTKEEFILGIENALKKRDLKTKFLASKDEKEKKKIEAEFKISRSVEGENFVFFADLIAYGLLNDKELKVEDKIKQLGELYIYSTDTSFVEKLGAEIKKIDPEKKFGSARLFVIKEMGTLLMAKSYDKAYEVYFANKPLIKGDDLGYAYQLGLQLKEEGKTDKTIEILTFILADEEIKKNAEAVKDLTAQMDALKKPKQKEGKVIDELTIKLKDEPAKKVDDSKAGDKPQEKTVPAEKANEAPAEKPKEKSEEKGKDLAVPPEKM